MIYENYIQQCETNGFCGQISFVITYNRLMVVQDIFINVNLKGESHVKNIEGLYTESGR